MEAKMMAHYPTIIQTFNPKTGQTDKWKIPTTAELIKHNKATWGEKWDRIERTKLAGGIPMLIERIG